MDIDETSLKKIIAEKLGIDEEKITDNASFIEDLGADSLETVELVMAIEETFGVEIPDEEAEKLRNLREVKRFIAGYQKS